jgi:hypothetical protein
MKQHLVVGRALREPLARIASADMHPTTSDHIAREQTRALGSRPMRLRALPALAR